MKRPVTRTWFALLWLALCAVGCGHDIGDECQTSIDCDPNGTRSCDLSQPGGYSLGAQAGEQAIADVVANAGFTRFRRAAETPFNIVYEARP